MRQLPTGKRAQIIAMLVEGVSLRAISRIADVSINTVTKLLVDAGRACRDYHDEHVRSVKSERVQVDEIWSFCYAKAGNVEKAKKAPEGAGDVWTWTGIDADAKLIVSWLIGPRDGQSAYFFMQDLAGRLDGRVQLTSDGLNVYPGAVEDAFGANVDYAQLIKLYGQPDRESEARYSPAVCKGAVPQPVQGEPKAEHISTSYVERHNLTMRMSMRRYTRLTNAFSKKLENHAHHVALYTMFFNFCRVHKTLRMSPAMAAGVTDTLRDAEWIVGLVDAAASTPGPRGPYLQEARRFKLRHYRRSEQLDARFRRRRRCRRSSTARPCGRRRSSAVASPPRSVCAGSPTDVGPCGISPPSS